MKIQNLFIMLALGAGILSATEAPKPTLITIIRDRTKTEVQKISEIKNLLKEGVTVDTKSLDIPYFTPLMIAADGGYTKIVQFLLDNGADVNALDNLNSQALFYAARKGHVEVVKLLLARGSNVKHVNKQGRTILQDTLYQIGGNEPSKENREARAQFRKNILSVVDLLVSRGADINMQGSAAELKRSPIMWAAFWKDLDLVKYFKEKGADLHQKDQSGNALEFYLPDPKRDKYLTAKEIEIINMLRDEILETGWTNIKSSR